MVLPQYGPQYVNDFVKQREKEMREFARQRGIRNPIGVRLDKWGLERRKDVREGEGKEGGKGGDKNTDVGLERPCCCIVCQ